MSTSIGIRRRTYRPRQKVPQTWTVPDLSPPFSVLEEQDAVARWDALSLRVLMNADEARTEHVLPVVFSRHERSPYVISLRHAALLSPLPGERLWRDALTSKGGPSVLFPRPDVFATLSTDLALSSSFPYATSEQFTSSEFWGAYRKSYGRMKGIRDRGRLVIQRVLGMFRRIDRIEERIANEAHEAFTLFEVPRWALVRGVAGFLGLALVVTLPAQAIGLYRSTKQRRDVIEVAGTRALADIAQAKQEQNVQASGEALKRASLHFREADAALHESYALALGIASVLPQQYRSARALFEVGDKSSEAARLLAAGVEKVFSDESRGLDERLDVLGTYARGVLPLLSDATRAAAAVDPQTLPENKRQEFSALRTRLGESAAAIREFSGVADMLARLVGKDEARRYVIIFQNQTELRPTGGFMGSLAEVTLDRGTIKKMFVPPGGTYDVKGQLVARVASPGPLHLINPVWQFQDANWNPDFPSAARKINWFWSKAGQPTVDGIIAVNASVVEKLLGLTGPIEIPAYGKTISRENFLLETQKAVELEYDKTANAPKKFLGDLAPLLLKRLASLSREDMIKAALVLSESLETKDIQAAFRDPDEEALAERYGWNGQMKDTPGDSLALIEANIAGQKTDGMIQERVEHHAVLGADGRLTDDVTLTRTHTGVKGQLFRGVRNVSYLRMYVPEGSILLSATGFEAPSSTWFKPADENAAPDPDIERIERTSKPGAGGTEVTVEGKRTVFGGWVQLDPGQTQTIHVRYELPFTLRDVAKRLELTPEGAARNSEAYLLLLTSQAGRPRTIHHAFHLPPDRTIAWQRGATSSSSGMELDEKWDRDRVVAALVLQHDSQE